MKQQDNTERLPPGSKEAIEYGCTCPVMDNCSGKGHYITEDGMTVYVMRTDCPLHGCDDLETLFGTSS
jgi:hypothetical protein